jgi:hypothetical protein
MQMNRLLASAALALAVSLTAASANASELITNGDFSASDAGWSISSNAFNFNGAAYREGAYNGEGSISQTFLDAVGGLLTLDYDWSGSGYQYVLFNGSTVAGSLTENTGGHYTFSLGAGTGSDTIAFYGRNDPSYNALDNVSITQTAGVPEPASWALMLTGFLGAGSVLRANRRRVAVATA